MRKIFTIVAASLTIGAFAQQDAQFSMNMFNKQVINPGYIGTTKSLCATALYRQQWVSFPGAPKTGLVALDAYLPPVFGGLGLTFCNDQLGVENNTIAKLGYSFHINNLGPGMLGIGIDLGMLQKRISGNWISTDPYTQDAAIPDLAAKDAVFNAGFGLYYTLPDERVYFGLSSTNIPQTSLSASNTTGAGSTVQDAFNFKLARHYYIMAGAKLNATPELSLRPSILAKTDASSTQLDINLLADYVVGTGGIALFGGGSYRLTDAIVAILGVRGQSAKMGWRVGYSYDITTSDIKNYSNNTHEILLNFCYNIVKPPKEQSYDNVRNMGRYKEVQKKDEKK